MKSLMFNVLFAPARELVKEWQETARGFVVIKCLLDLCITAKRPSSLPLLCKHMSFLQLPCKGVKRDNKISNA